MEQQSGGAAVRDRRQLERARALPTPSDALPKYGGHGYVPAEPGAAPVQIPAVAPLAVDMISGVVLDARDFAAARDFYATILRDRSGTWEEHDRRLVYSDGTQRIELVRRPRPRTLAHAGQHVAYRVPADQLRAITDQLAQAGHEVNWWREDHPNERSVTAYVNDPSGNVVQLVASDDPGLLIDHYYVPVEDIEHGELFYVKGIQGQIDTYYGYRTEDVMEAHRWAEGEDPCAPWTRNAYISFRTRVPNPTPAAQIFARFGRSYIGVTLTGQRLPEPPEEFLKATPRAVLHSPQSPREVTTYLASVRISPVSLKYDGGQIRFRREGRNVFLRDRSGNFLQIECAG
jgi:hypothetical protein